jgi:hypothetical protein
LSEKNNRRKIMKLLKGLGIALSVTVLCALVVPSAGAQLWNHKTIITFSGPVEVPGVGQHNLPAGTYVFKIMDSLADRHIVQIFNQDGTHLFTTILAIPNLRLKATDKTVITFRERPAGEPEALRAWFYPGSNSGEEFVYARPRAIELAKEANTPVLATEVELDSAPVEVLKTAPVEAITPTGEPVEIAQVVELPPAATTEPVSAPAATALPKGASELPLIALIGLLTIGAGLGLSAFSKQAVRTK